MLWIYQKIMARILYLEHIIIFSTVIIHTFTQIISLFKGRLNLLQYYLIRRYEAAYYCHLGLLRLELTIIQAAIILNQIFDI